jgi:hypothetical protein
LRLPGEAEFLAPENVGAIIAASQHALTEGGEAALTSQLLPP